MSKEKQERSIKRLLWLFVISLIISGVTAFFLHWELSVLEPYVAWLPEIMEVWFERVNEAIKYNREHYSFLAYGTDWLAFAHIVIAVAFYGPIKDPIKNIWVIQFGMIACLMVFPLAFIAGSIRGIPFFWQLIDCSFGVFGFLLLWIIYRKVKSLESMVANHGFEH